MSIDESPSPLEQLRTPIQFIKGVGEERAAKLERVGIRSSLDALFFFPRDYEEVGELCSINHLEDGKPASVIGEVVEISTRSTMRGKQILTLLVKEGGHALRLVWFNQPFLERRFRYGMRLLVSGTPKLKGFTPEMSHPRTSVMQEGEAPPLGELLPVYSLTEGISQPQMRRIVHQVVEAGAKLLEEVLPESLRDELALCPISKAIEEVHRPTSKDLLGWARHRLIFQELLVLQLALAVRRKRIEVLECAPAIEIDNKLNARIMARFPFDFTSAQKQAVEEIRSDLGRRVPMNRLLQGDVGCGKTAVAMYSMLACAATGRQAVLMAPTEVLARQHTKTLDRILAGSRLDYSLLAGGLTQREREEVLAQIAAGTSQIVIGTQAIIQDAVKFHDLGLVVVDEQHKFGVKQREVLKNAETSPHYLVMTATPIPRTVSMTLFGDLDVSTLREAPPGRHQVHTYIGQQDERKKWWDFFRKKLDEGRQGYVITPLVEDSNELGLANVLSVYEDLVNEELAEYRLGLLHGRLSNQAKQEAMQLFATGDTQVLVATSVVEVGIDVGNATIMAIESAERFGLAQLHQLRGRVSRGAFDGYVCAFADTSSEDAQRRMAAFASTNDGFKLAELDFELRGPGNLFGIQQHGLPPFRIADLRRDSRVLQEARDTAFKIIDEDPMLHSEPLKKLGEMVRRRYGKVLDLGDVG